MVKQDVLFAVIRAGLGLPSSLPQFSYEDIQQLKQIGSRQSILQIIWAGLKTSSLRQEWKQEIEADVYNCIMRYVWREESLRRVRTALDGAGIPYILLKGAVIQHLYPEGWMRSSNDIDILVREDDLPLAVKAIEDNTSFKAKDKGFHDVSMMSENYHLELHYSLREREEKIDPLLQKAWDYAEQAEEGSRYKFTPEYEIFYVTAHMAHHFSAGGLGIRPFIDLWLLTDRTEYSQDLLYDLLDSCGLRVFYEKCLKLSSVWMEGAAHDKTSLRLEKFCLRGGALGSGSLANIARQRRHKGWRYVLSRVWVPKYELLSNYGDEPGEGKHSTLYYQVKRWKSWFGSKRRPELKKQIGNLNGAEGSEIDEFSKLCEELSLE